MNTKNDGVVRWTGGVGCSYWISSVHRDIRDLDVNGNTHVITIDLIFYGLITVVLSAVQACRGNNQELRSRPDNG